MNALEQRLEKVRTLTDEVPSNLALVTLLAALKECAKSCSLVDETEVEAYYKIACEQVSRLEDVARLVGYLLEDYREGYLRTPDQAGEYELMEDLKDKMLAAGFNVQK